MRETTVARVYAETLLEVARDRRAVDRIAGEVEALRGVLEQGPILRRFLESPRIAIDEKKSVLRGTLADRLSEETLRFLELVVEKRREALLDEILNEFGALVDELHNRRKLEVSSATPLPDDLRDRLREVFATASGSEIVLEERVDPRLLGGLIVQLGDLRIDGSLRTRLESLRHRMLQGARAAAAGQP